MAFSTEQIYLLNTLSYMSTENIYDASEHKTVESFVEGILNSDNNLHSIADNDGFMTADQIRAVCEQIRADDQLMQMDIAYADRTEGGADRLIFTTEDAGGEKQAIVVFEGTKGGNEWRDNFLAGTKTDQRDGVSSAEQAKTLSWFKSDSKVNEILDSCEGITVSGHSKGGNKAKYLTLFDERIDSCVSFDGQGFSDDFVKKYENVIRMNQDKIQNYNHKADYVNNLLNDIGEAHFINGKDCGADFLQNHSVFALYDGIPFAANETEQWQPMAEMDKILNGYLRSLNPSEKKTFMSLLGELTADFVSGTEPFGIDDLYDYYFRWNLGGERLLKGFIVYAFAYGGFELCEMIESWIKDSLPWLGGWLEQAREMAKNVTGVTDGEDIRYDSLAPLAMPAAVLRPLLSGANGNGGLLVMDTDELRRLSSQASSLCSSLNSCAAQAEKCAALCDEYEIRIRLSMNLRLRSAPAGAGVAGASPAEVLRSLGKNMRALERAAASLSSGMSKAAGSFEDNEEKIMAGMPKNTGTAAAF